MRRMMLVLAGLAVFAAFVGGAAPASAQANFTVDPVQIYLNPVQNTALLTFTNHGTTELRLELSAYVWRHDEDSIMDLEPTESIIFFPQLVALEPGREQRVRIGVQEEFGPVEKPFRLIIAELPSGAAAPGGQVMLRTTVSIPVFMSQQGESAGSIDFLASTEGRTVSGLITNTGNIHILADAVEFKGYDAEGRVVFQENQPGWYVLPGLKRRFDFELTDAICRSVIRVDAIAIGHGSMVSQTVDVTDNCR